MKLLHELSIYDKFYRRTQIYRFSNDQIDKLTKCDCKVVEKIFKMQSKWKSQSKRTNIQKKLDG